VAEELVAQALALAGAADEAGDVDQLDDGGDDLLGLDLGLDAQQARVGHREDADVGLDGAERVVRASAPAAVSALNRVLLPTLGSPTMPA
jgi:hypothetical protein